MHSIGSCQTEIIRTDSIYVLFGLILFSSCSFLPCEQAVSYFCVSWSSERNTSSDSEAVRSEMYGTRGPAGRKVFLIFLRLALSFLLVPLRCGKAFATGSKKCILRASKSCCTEQLKGFVQEAHK